MNALISGTTGRIKKNLCMYHSSINGEDYIVLDVRFDGTHCTCDQSHFGHLESVICIFGLADKGGSKACSF